MPINGTFRTACTLITISTYVFALLWVFFTARSPDRSALRRLTRRILIGQRYARQYVISLEFNLFVHNVLCLEFSLG